MPKKTAPISKALTEDEFALLSEILEEHAAFDIDGVLGLLHAVVVAPSLMPPSSWLPVLLPNGFEEFDKDAAQQFIGLVMRLYNEVVDGLKKGALMMPEAADVEECESFAGGFAAGAEIDPEWIGDEAHWTFASWAAYLAGRDDLVPEHTREKFDVSAEKTRMVIRRDMAALVLGADEHFKKLRLETLGQAAPSPARAAARVGRNDPCPCGSGKKYKKCCIDAVTPEH